MIRLALDTYTAHIQFQSVNLLLFADILYYVTMATVILSGKFSREVYTLT